jgi:hypothetical protein
MEQEYGYAAVGFFTQPAQLIKGICAVRKNKYSILRKQRSIAETCSESVKPLHLAFSI